MSTPCPHCGQSLADSPQLAGMLVACPSCSGTFPLPPAPPPFASAPPPPPPVMSVTMPARRIPANKWPRMIRSAMLIVTGLWLLAMVALFALGLAAHFGDRDIVDQGFQVVDMSTGRVQRKGEWISAGLLGAATFGICFPTVPYAIAMTALGVSLLATKKD